MDPYDLVVFVDACSRQGKPGDIYLIEPEALGDMLPSAAPLEPHGMKPMSVLRLVKSMGGASNKILIVGCEPADLGSDDEGKLGLSEPVEAAVDRAIELVEKIVAEKLAGKTMQSMS